MKINNFMIFLDFFKVDNSVLAIPELWNTLEYDDPKFLKYIKPYVFSQFSHEIYANDEFLQINNIQFFDAIKKYCFFSMFFSKPDNYKLSYNSQPIINIDDNIIFEKIKFIGYLPMSELGSPFLDGIYPIYTDGKNVINTKKFNDISINKFGLLCNYKECQYICHENDIFFSTNNDWYPSGIYVDYHTFNTINMV